MVEIGVVNTPEFTSHSRFWESDTPIPAQHRIASHRIRPWLFPLVFPFFAI
jgi:hypothetical protein